MKTNNPKVPSNFQQAIDGEWHGCPSLFEPDGTHVGHSKVSRSSEFKDGRTTYWMNTRFNASGPLQDRFELGSGFEFGVIDSDRDRIYTGPDFYGSGRPYGLLVDSFYYSPGWNTNLRTVNLVVPDLEMQVYSSQLFEGDTLIGVFNGLYKVTEHLKNLTDEQKQPIQTKIDEWLELERIQGRTPFNLPVKHAGKFSGEFECYDADQQLVGINHVVVHHRPINLLHSEQTIEISGVINARWTALRTRTGNHQQFHGPDLFGNAMSYGRYLYSTRHVSGEANKLWSRETVIDENHTTVCVWKLFQSQQEKYTTFGVLRWAQEELVLGPRYVDDH